MSQMFLLTINQACHYYFRASAVEIKPRWSFGLCLVITKACKLIPIQPDLSRPIFGWDSIQGIILTAVMWHLVRFWCFFHMLLMTGNSCSCEAARMQNESNTDSAHNPDEGVCVCVSVRLCLCTSACVRVCLESGSAQTAELLLG